MWKKLGCFFTSSNHCFLFLQLISGRGVEATIKPLRGVGGSILIPRLACHLAQSNFLFTIVWERKNGWNALMRKTSWQLKHFIAVDKVAETGSAWRRIQLTWSMSLIMHRSTSKYASYICHAASIRYYSYVQRRWMNLMTVESDLLSPEHHSQSD